MMGRKPMYLSLWWGIAVVGAAKDDAQCQALAMDTKIQCRAPSSYSSWNRVPENCCEDQTGKCCMGLADFATSCMRPDEYMSNSFLDVFHLVSNGHCGYDLCPLMTEWTKQTCGMQPTDDWTMLTAPFSPNCCRGLENLVIQCSFIDFTFEDPSFPALAKYFQSTCSSYVFSPLTAEERTIYLRGTPFPDQEMREEEAAVEPDEKGEERKGKKGKNKKKNKKKKAGKKSNKAKAVKKTKKKAQGQK